MKLSERIAQMENGYVFERVSVWATSENDHSLNDFLYMIFEFDRMCVRYTGYHSTSPYDLLADMIINPHHWVVCCKIEEEPWNAAGSYQIAKRRKLKIDTL